MVRRLFSSMLLLFLFLETLPDFFLVELLEDFFETMDLGLSNSDAAFS